MFVGGNGMCVWVGCTWAVVVVVWHGCGYRWGVSVGVGVDVDVDVDVDMGVGGVWARCPLSVSGGWVRARVWIVCGWGVGWVR